MRRRLARGTAVAGVLVGALVLQACGDTDADQQASAVDITVPDDWTRSDPEVTADVVESLRWMPPRDDGSSLQVVVGCGPDTNAEELLAGAMAGERPLPVVGGVEEPVEVEVDGLDDARQGVFALGPSSDDLRMWMAGVYGVGDGVLVLVELVRPREAFDEEQAEDVLSSVSVDTSDVAERCADAG